MSCPSIPARQHAPEITPKSSPLNASIYTVPIPAVIPSANVVSDTARLFVIMALDARGFTVTIECVHICCLAIVSIISGPKMYRWNPGSVIATINPAAAVAKKIAVARSVYGKVS